MFTYPEFLLQLSDQRQRELRAEADTYRLLAAARWARRHRRRTGRRREPDRVSDRAGTLAAWAASGEPAR